MSLRKLSRSSWVLFVAMCVGACAEERDAINRVQANALSKEFFVGDVQDASDDPVFLARNFVVDASESQSLVGISTGSGLERMRWQITETMLFGRKAYSVTSGDDKGTSDDPNGAIVAAYRIQSHFDIRNAYNPSTGEELNVVEENTSDRAWSEREYFRVDWSQNLVNSPVWTEMFFGQTFGDITVTPVAYFESDPQANDAPHFVPEDGYFDITSHFLVEPEKVSYYNFELPLCMLMGFMTGSAIYSCDPQEAVLRSSYWRLDKADPDDDFEPFANTDAPLDVFGNPGGIGDGASAGLLTAPIEKYDPGYGFTDEGFRRYMNIHNVWKQSHQTRGTCETDNDCESLTNREGSVCLASKTCSVPCNYDARSDADHNGSDDQCENSDTGYEGSGGAQCSARNRCTLPYRDRDLKTITYHVNQDMPKELQDTLTSSGKVKKRGANEDLGSTWNQALSVAIANAREVECQRADAGPQGNEKRAACHAKFFKVDEAGRDRTQMVGYGGWGLPSPKDAQPVLTVCHNPVRDYDAPECGEAGTTARDGDLRKNFLIYWPYDTQAPYGGIGNWRGDPATGQIVGAAATTIGSSATRAAARARDLTLVALGELNLTDITDGVAASRFEKTLREGRAPRVFTKQELDAKVRNIDIDHLRSQITLNSDVPADLPLSLAALAFKGSMSASSGVENRNLLRFQALAKPLLGTDLEASLVDPNWLVDATGLGPDTLLTEEVLNATSPLRGQDPGMLGLLSRRFEKQMGARGVCFLEAGEGIGNPDLSGLGPFYRNKYPDLQGEEFAEQVYEDLWVESYKGIALHELGHSLGLLHNFTSSYDAMNYNPQYWQLRTQEGQAESDCQGQPRVGSDDTCMGPRYLDPETPDEQGLGAEPRPGIAYFANTSTMEYQTTRFHESAGLGQYDAMAMGALYGRVLETLDERDFTPSEQLQFQPLTFTQLSDDISLADSNVHYTELGRQLRLFDANRCRAATADEIAHAEWRIVHGQVCAPPPKNHGHWDDFVDATDPAVFGSAISGRKMRVPEGLAVPAAGNSRWQYRFGGDMSNSYLHVNPSDSGADAYELTREAIEKNDYDYPLNYFRAQRRGWRVDRLPSQSSRNFYERLRSYHWNISSTNAFFNEVVPTSRFQELQNDDNGLRPYLIAQNDMFEAISRAFLVPEPGAYTQSTLEGSLFDLVQRGSVINSFVLDASAGRFLAPSFDSTAGGGGSWNYSEFMRRSGFSVEKSLASLALTDGRPTLSFVGRDIYLDDRGINISFRTDMPRAVDRLLGGILAEDWGTVAPYIDSPAAPELKVRDLQAASPEALSSRARSIFPNIGYNQQLPTMIYAYLFGTLSDDITLSTKMRIWLQGSISGELDVPEAEQARFLDPETGITYVARRYGTEELYGQTVDTGIGSRMVARANTLLAKAFETELDQDGEVILNEFGQPELKRDDAGHLIPTDETTAQQTYRHYVGLLDSTVRIGTWIGHGPLL